MRSTAEKVLEACSGLKRQHDGSYRGACPYRTESDSNAFVLTIHDGEHGAWIDHARNDNGSLYELAVKLNIEIPKDGRVQVENSKLPYADLQDYAKRHHVPVEVFKAAGWEDCRHQGKKSVSWGTQSGKRIRFIEGSESDLKNPYRWEKTGSENCWYGLSRALKLANEKNVPLIFCNGEASTVVAQHAVSDSMLAELQERWKGQIYICMDCDKTGREAAEDLKKLLGNSGLIVDLQLSDKGDLADFCGLHRDMAMNALKNIVSSKKEANKAEVESFIEFVSGNEILSQFSSYVWDAPELFGRVIQMPFASLRATGGFAEYMTTKKIWLIGNVSGGGKTIFSETLCDEWNALGYNVFYVGDEWTPMELTARRVQRASRVSNPVSYMDYLAYTAGNREFSDGELEAISYAIRSIRMREGQTYYMQIAQGSRQVPFLEDILEAIVTKVEALRANNVRVDVIVLDYLSLYETRGRANNLEEYKVGIFKSYCKSLDVLGVSTVQVNKDAEDRVKNKGGFLTQHDLYWVRADKGNLISTMNRLYKSRAEVEPWEHLDRHEYYKPYLDENGQAEPTPNFAMITVKNSVSSPYEYAYFHFDFVHMCVREGLHPEYYFDRELGQVLPLSMKEPKLGDLDL
jgi:5S rRNA maturation endonuclease (ribonuclease M5)